MSKDIKTIEGPHNIDLHQYSGGNDKGLCVQITGRNCDNMTGYVGLTVTETYKLTQELTKWLQGISTEKAEHLQKQIDKCKELKNTIVNDAVDCERFIRDIEIIKLPLMLLHGTDKE